MIDWAYAATEWWKELYWTEEYGLQQILIIILFQNSCNSFLCPVKS